MEGGTRQLDPESLGAHVARLYRAAYGLCGSRQDAEDLVQDTFERVLRRPRFLRRDQDVVYLLRVLRNTWISSGRAKRQVPIAPAGDEIEEVEAPNDPITQSIESAAVYEALQELTQPLREALVAVDVLGLSYREAAQRARNERGHDHEPASSGAGARSPLALKRPADQAMRAIARVPGRRQALAPRPAWLARQGRKSGRNERA